MRCVVWCMHCTVFGVEPPSETDTHAAAVRDASPFLSPRHPSAQLLSSRSGTPNSCRPECAGCSVSERERQRDCVCVSVCSECTTLAASSRPAVLPAASRRIHQQPTHHPHQGIFNTPIRRLVDQDQVPRNHHQGILLLVILLRPQITQITPVSHLQKPQKQEPPAQRITYSNTYSTVS
ncbi:hypothetical protein LZ30DRAFT_367928 [Colletotrichum cereale]|nr:hypothetical protein LZ30DRAFT_367928 [Colletotrichum cereale]